MSDPHDHSIPVLHEVLVPGNPAQANPASTSAAEPGTLREPSFRTQPVLTPEQVSTAEPVHAHEPTLAPEPAHAPKDTAHAADAAPAPHPAHPADHHHPKKRSRAHHAAEPRHAHGDAHAPSAGVFDRAEPATPLEAGSIVPPDIAREGTARSPLTPDAEVIAERLRGRFAAFLTGEGSDIIEARCRETLQEHTGWLVNQITREVAMTLETEMTGWVREAVEEEIARRSGNA